MTHLSSKKLLCAALALSNLFAPSLVLAQSYGYRASVRDLAVEPGSSGGTPGGTPAAVLQSSASSTAFGSVIVGGVSPAHLVTFTNTGTVTAQTGTAYTSAEYSVSNECNSVILAPTQSCVVSVRFSPLTVKNFAPGTLALPYSFSGSTGNPLATASFTAIGAPVPVVYAPVLSMNAAGVDFSAVEVGSSATRRAVLSNTGNTPAVLEASSLPQDISVVSDCPAELAPGQSCNWDFTFAPSAAVVRSGVFLVGATGFTQFASLSLTGAGQDTFLFETSSSSLSFLPLEGASKSVVVVNTGSGTLSAPDIQVQGAGFTASHNCTELQPSASCLVTVTRPIQAPGSLTATLSVDFAQTSATTVAVQSLLQGTVLTVLSNATQSFGTVAVGQQGPVLTYLVHNEGNLPASLQVSAPASAAVTLGGTCTGLLAPSASCEIVLSYLPASHGAISGTLTVTDTLGARDFAGTAQLHYSGQGQGTPVLSMSISGGEGFPATPVGQAATKIVTLTNTGTLGATSVELSVGGHASFTLASTCPAALAMGQSCTGTLTFTPQDASNVSATLSASATDAAVALQGVQGTGQLPALSLTPATYDFGVVPIGDSVQQSFTLTNSGNLSATLAFSPVAAPVTRSGTCAATLAPGASCTVVLTYAPTSASTTTVNLTASSSGFNQSGTSAAVAITGTGQANPSFSLSAVSLAYGHLSPTGSQTQAVSIQNTGNVPLTAPAVDTLGSGFSSTTNCATLAPGQSCVANVSLSHNGNYLYTGSLRVAFQEAAMQLTALSGTGDKVLVLGGGGARQWADGTVAASCKGYLTPPAGYAYSGSTGSGDYSIDIDGAGAEPVVNVYCDMTTSGGGWTLVAWNKGNSPLSAIPADFMVQKVNSANIANRSLLNTASSLNVEAVSNALNTTDVMLKATGYSATPIIELGQGKWTYDSPDCSGVLGHSGRSAGCSNNFGNDDYSNHDRFNIAIYPDQYTAIVPAHRHHGGVELCWSGRGVCDFQFYLR